MTYWRDNTPCTCNNFGRSTQPRSLLNAALSLAVIASGYVHASPETNQDIFTNQQCQWLKPDDNSKLTKPFSAQAQVKLPDYPNAKIGTIRVIRHNIFDENNPKESNWLFKLANSINSITNEEVILTQLLFKQGDDYSAKLVMESERILRDTKYLYDAKISVDLDCDDQVHVTIETKELWTLMPELDFSRSGGENKSRIGFRETNLLGTGKRVSFTKRSDSERTGYTFIYDDPNVLSSRYTSRFEYSDNDDGERFYLDFKLPFYALSTPLSYGFALSDKTQTTPLYGRGEQISEFKHKSHVALFHFGFSKQQANWVHRTLFGWQDEKDEFESLPTTFLPIADDRRMSYPWMGLHSIEDNYIKLSNFDSIGRTEDLNLGWELFGRVGYSAKNVSNHDNSLVFEASASKAHTDNPTRLWRFYGSLQGYWNFEHNQFENLYAKLALKMHQQTAIDRAWFVNSELHYTDGLTADTQLSLGGDNGLRGYPLNYQQGDKAMLVNIEKRYYWEYHLLQLFKVGGAAFFDVGQAWFNQSHANNVEGLLSNVGVGLRFAPSRATAKTVVHFDIAVPLSQTENIDSVQYLLTVKNTF